MSVEQWRDIPGWEGYYAVSDSGRVKSLARVVHNPASGPMRIRERILRQHPRPQGSRPRSGHLMVSLTRDGKETSVYVHRMVLLAFVGPAPEGLIARHLDGDPTNNLLSNLRWGTPSENGLDSVAHGTHHFSRRTHCPVGHEYTLENTYVTRSSNRRRCRTCETARRAARWKATRR